MLCPVCEIEMLILEFQNIEIDYCHKCAGIWLDEGELELLLDEKQKQNSPIFNALASMKPAKKCENRKCPVCRNNMKTVKIMANTEVEIDKCPHNHGLWFDAGELQQIAKFADSCAVAEFLNCLFAKT